MSYRKFTPALALAALGLVAVLAEPTWAQGGGRGGRGGGGRGMMGRGFRAFHQVELATLPEVQDELKLTDEQKTSIDELEDTYSDERRAQRGGGRGGGGGGGFGPPTEAQLAAQAKLSADYAAKLNEVLDDAQDARILGIFAQVNGTRALTDPAIVAALELSEDDVQELRDVAAEQVQAMGDAFREFQGQDMSDEERTTKLQELQGARDAALLAVLSDEQRTALDGLKGDAIEVDTSSLQGRGGRGGRGGGGGRGGDDGDDNGGGAGGRPAVDE